MDIFWKEYINCGFCDTKFIASVEDVKYGDMRLPHVFRPDWQYYVECRCGKKHVVTSLPTSTASSIQKLFNAQRKSETASDSPESDG